MSSNLILIVDDCQEIRTALADILTTFEYRIATAENGETAIAFLCNNELPLCAIVDIHMPVLGGLEFVQIVRNYAHMHTLPIILISAVKPPKLPQTNVFFLAKPFTGEDLLALIKSLPGGESLSQ